MSTVLAVNRAGIIAHPERELDECQRTQIELMLARREAGEPMAYILGRREFYRLEFAVTPDVLIPRPETELLVEQVLARISSNVADIKMPVKRVLDLGTGSGAIAVSVAAERPGVSVTATDISERALVIAKRNAGRHGVNIHFIESDWFSEIGAETFDIIVSNPPYIALGDRHLCEGDLRFEPPQALTDWVKGAQGLACIRQIVADAPSYLSDGGWLLFEHGFDQADACRQLLSENGFVELVAIADLAGIIRVSGGRKG